MFWPEHDQGYLVDAELSESPDSWQSIPGKRDAITKPLPKATSAIDRSE